MNGADPGLSAWLPYREIQRASWPKIRVFCFPYAGGTARIYRNWSSFGTAGLEFLPVQLPGREKRIGESPFTRMEALIDALIHVFAEEFAKGPFALFGHSMGGKIAFELAKTLEMQTAFAPCHLFVAGICAPQLKERTPGVHHLGDAALINELRRVGGTPEAVLENQELMRIVLPFIQADYALSETWTYQPGPRLRCPIRVFGGDTDPDVNLQELVAWREQTTAEFGLQILEGDHFFINDQAASLIAEINASLSNRAAGKLSQIGEIKNKHKNLTGIRV